MLWSVIRTNHLAATKYLPNVESFPRRVDQLQESMAGSSLRVRASQDYFALLEQHDELFNSRVSELKFGVDEPDNLGDDLQTFDLGFVVNWLEAEECVLPSEPHDCEVTLPRSWDAFGSCVPSFKHVDKFAELRADNCFQFQVEDGDERNDAKYCGGTNEPSCCHPNGVFPCFCFLHCLFVCDELAHALIQRQFRFL